MLSCTNSKAQSLASGNTIDTALQPAQQWFNAWELVSRKVYGIDTLKPVAFIFFDDTWLYTTWDSNGRDNVPVNGPRFFGQAYNWKKYKHQGMITLPGNQQIPIGLMSFAIPVEHSTIQSVFIMPLPAFWKQSGVDSKELGVTNLITGVFLHEFSHSQQMDNFGAKLTEYETTYTYTVEFTDDLIQHYFEKDSVYSGLYQQELNTLFQAATAVDKDEVTRLTKQALDILTKRQTAYFTGDNAHLQEIDAFFLTMEGIGQYSMYAWMVHPEGGNIPAELALKGVRRNGRWWSQDEGLATILVLSEYIDPKIWSRYMFGKTTISAVDLIRQSMKASD